ncbi:MAG: putative motility protein [Desulfovibrionaceae bacterium]|nr:putative motility protein [Desulfovibrionaceae bacterium]
MDGVSGASTQQVFGLAIQKSALETQANMVSKLMEGASAGMQQPSQPAVGLRVDALSERGIGTRLSVVA